MFSQSKGKLIYRDSDATFIPHKSFQDEISVGACNGTFELQEIINETFNKINDIFNKKEYMVLSPRILSDSKKSKESKKKEF